MKRSDYQICTDAVREARRILSRYIEPGQPRETRSRPSIRSCKCWTTTRLMPPKRIDGRDHFGLVEFKWVRALRSKQERTPGERPPQIRQKACLTHCEFKDSLSDGDPSRIRTCDPRSRNPLLEPALPIHMPLSVTSMALWRPPAHL